MSLNIKEKNPGGGALEFILTGMLGWTCEFGPLGLKNVNGKCDHTDKNDKIFTGIMKTRRPTGQNQ